MGGEGGQRLLYALFVPNIRKNPIEYRHPHRRFRRKEKAGLRHCRKKAHKLQRNRFSARIGTRNHKRAHAVFQVQGNGNHLFRIDQRMPPFIDFKRSLFGECDGDRLHFKTKRRFGKEHVELGQYFNIFPQFLLVRIQQGRKLRKDTRNLAGFLALKLADAVVGFHNARRFHKKSRAGAAFFMDNPGNVTLVFRFDGHHKTPVSLCNDRILQIFGIALRANHGLQLFPDRFVLLAHCAADAGKLGRGVVRHLVLRQNAV
ncbi:MAG: hypothetical protein DELT_03234 [Desulfovibrio sp.]